MANDEPHANKIASTRRRAPNLLFVLAANVFGGAEVQTHILLRGLCNNFNITLLTHTPIAPRFSGLPVLPIDFESFGLSSPYYYGWRNVVAYADAIGRVAENRQADIVYAVMHNSSLFVAAARVLHPRRMRHRIVIGSLHGSFVGYFEQRSAPPSYSETAAIRTVIRIMDSIVTPSQGVAHELVDIFGARRNIVHPIHNGFDLQAIRDAARERLPEPKQGSWIVTCCRLNEQKDFRTLIEAFSRIKPLSGVKLVIVGDGPERDLIERLVEAYGLTGKVLLTGYQQNPFPWIQAADVFVLSSHYEGFGNVIVEAYALGVPVLASDCRWGPAEIIEHGVNGLLFPPGDAFTLARYLDQLLGDSLRREQMGKAAALRSEHFSQDRMAQEYMQVFNGFSQK